MKKMIVILTLLLAIAGGTYAFMQQAVFGKEPEGQRLVRMQASPNYRDGAFQNLIETPMYPPDISYWKMTKHLLQKPKNVKPPRAIPFIKTDLVALQAPKPTIIWFGHSSYLIKSQDFTVLVDPVFSGQASPVSFFGKAFDGADHYKAQDMPAIDALILSHDHYDHLDYKSILELAPKTKHFYTALGVGAHLEHWGIPAEKITEMDWWQHEKISEAIAITATPARHFSGRKITRNLSLWASYVLDLHGYRIFLGGDSGMAPHFAEIGQKYGPFDIALLENGQYAPEWPYIHSMPEETIQIAKQLNAKVLMPLHWAKFELSYHPWNEPIKRLTQAAKTQNQALCTPMIGQPVVVDSLYPKQIWWEF
jgi:L-ascorbate metabolism protein UlaG (beta-lactamase superfamily)